MNELYEERVKLTEPNHRYFHKDGREFTSLSRVRKTIQPDTDFKMMARNSAKARGVDVSVVQGEWDKTRDDAGNHGTIIHNSLELYGNTARILPENEHLRPMIISITSTESEYYQVYREKTLYDEEYEIAATADRIMATTRTKGSIMDLDDYKTNLTKGIYYTCKYKNYLKHPFDHVQNSNYYDYSLQLSCEAMMLEALTGRKIGRLTITFIPPLNPLAWRVIPVAYLKNDARILFKYFKGLKHIQANEGPQTISNEKSVIMPNFN